MSEKYIPNSYQTPNILVDEIMPLLTPIEWCVLSFAIRHILGWQDRITSREAEISLTRFESIGISRPAIISALSELETYKLLTKVGASGAKGQRWRLGFDEGVNFEGLQKRSLAKKEAGVKRSEKARSVGLTSQSDLPGAVSRTDRSGGQSDLHNETQGIQTQDQTHIGGAAKAPAVKGKFTASKWYAVNESKCIIGPVSYTKGDADQKSVELAAYGYTLIQGSVLNADVKYLAYRIKSKPRTPSALFDAFAESAFGMASDYTSDQLGKDDGGLIGTMINVLAELGDTTRNMIAEDADLSLQVRQFYKDFRKCSPGIKVPIHEGSFRRSWRSWINGDLVEKPAPKDRYASPQVTDVIYKKEW